MRPVTLILHLLPDEHGVWRGSVIDPLTDQQRAFVEQEAIWDVIVQLIERRIDLAKRSQPCFKALPASSDSSSPSS